VYAKAIKGVRYRYYGCYHSSQFGGAACSNRLRIRVETADQALLKGLQAALVTPDGSCPSDGDRALAARHDDLVKSANARLTQFATPRRSMCPRLRAARARGLRPSLRDLTPSSSRAIGNYAMLRIAAGKICA
jgi:hypothetical protein